MTHHRLTAISIYKLSLMTYPNKRNERSAYTSLSGMASFTLSFTPPFTRTMHSYEERHLSWSM